MKRPSALLLLCLSVRLAVAEDDPFERSPISYSSTAPRDAVTALEARLASGQLRLEGDEKQVVLTATLTRLPPTWRAAR